MMRKLVFFAFIILLIFFTFPSVGESSGEGEPEEFQVIPDEAIRLRILANSDGEVDQQIKETVRDEVNEEITKWVKDLTDIDEARQLIEDRIPEVDKIVADTLQAEGSQADYEVEYNDQVTFPTKVYGSYLYPAGEYEAVLITIGEGKGKNWWCVLFPPLCFLDFGNGTSVDEEESEAQQVSQDEDEEEDVKVKFFLFDWFGWS